MCVKCIQCLILQCNFILVTYSAISGAPGAAQEADPESLAVTLAINDVTIQGPDLAAREAKAEKRERMVPPGLHHRKRAIVPQQRSRYD